MLSWVSDHKFHSIEATTSGPSDIVERGIRKTEEKKSKTNWENVAIFAIAAVSIIAVMSILFGRGDSGILWLSAKQCESYAKNGSYYFDRG